MDKTEYKKVPASDGPEPSPTSPWVTSPTVVPSPTSPPEKAPGGSLQFAKAALAFHDQLGDIRKKHASTTTTVTAVGQPPESPPPSKEAAPSASPPPDAPAEKAGDALSDDPVVAKRLRILRLVQSTLTAIFSIAIAALQAKAYGCFESTKDGMCSSRTISVISPSPLRTILQTLTIPVLNSPRCLAHPSQSLPDHHAHGRGHRGRGL